MTPIVSPAEALGLAGAALDARVKNAARHISDHAFVRIAEQLRKDAWDNQVVYEHDGVPEAIRIMLRPLLAQRDQLTYVHHVCLQVTEALRRLPQLYLENEQVRKIVAVTPEEERWLRDIWTKSHGRNNSVYGRLDAVCDFASARWEDTLKFMEANLSGVGGIHFSPVAEQLVMRDLVPALLAQDPGLVIEPPQDQRDLFVQLLIDHARAMGREASQLCFIEPKYEHDGPDEQSALSRYLSERHGLVITHADPRELTVKNGEVYYEDIRVDVAYRDYELRDLIELEKEIGKPLDGMRLLFKENRIVSSLVGDFDHKSGFEILTDPELADSLFSPDDCRLFRRHVLWTRVVAERKTTLPDNRTGGLLDFIRTHREHLVMKPNRAYGGEGVAIGASMDEAAWDKLLDEAVAKGADPSLSWVVQAATEIPVSEFPVIGVDKRVYSEPFYTVMGFAASDNGLGTLCRVSQKQVVNVAQHGGLAALLIGEKPRDLRIPKRPQTKEEDPLAALRQRIIELHHLDQTTALLEWDEETNLPDGGRPIRGEQLGTLETIRHGLLTSDHLADALEEAARICGDNADLTREIHLLRRERTRALAVPEDLVRDLAAAKSLALAAWENARDANNFAVFAKPFSSLLELVRERANCLTTDADVYNALLDENEPGLTRARLEPLLAQLREKLVPLVRNAAEASANHTGALEGRHFPAAQQWELSRRLLTAMGFDFARGRLDASTHPFTMQASHDDVRVTSRVSEHDFTNNMLATMHEGGHALYDQGFVAGDRDSLLADGASAGLHEAMSRLWENHVGRSREFMEFVFPQLRELFPAALAGLDTERLWRSINAVRPGTNRVNADEMTYQLHIALRTELEVKFMSGDLPVGELPAIWNQRSEELIGVRPKSDLEGVLQDVHWAVGMFGYFPTYTIGNLYAAQLIETYTRDNDLRAQIRQGEFAPLRNWLTKNIYQIGNRLPAEDIVENATGRGLDTAAYFAHISSPDRAWR